MKATPLFLGACALASITGVVSGASINTQPIQHAGIGMDEIARPEIAFDAGDTGLSDQVALPDHYALRTPEGRFEVGELSNRGLYAQRRFGWRDATWSPPPEPAFSEPQADPEWSASADDLAAEAAPAIVPLPATATSANAMQDNAPQASTPPGQPRVIDVQSELARRAS